VNIATPTKVIKRDMIAFVQDAFEGIGEEQGLTGLQAFTKWASNPANQSQFYTQIWAKLIPKDIKSTITGDEGGPVKLSISWLADPSIAEAELVDDEDDNDTV
jgi:hypothetical protein